jgi:hypothetical protein
LSVFHIHRRTRSSGVTDISRTFRVSDKEVILPVALRAPLRSFRKPPNGDLRGIAEAKPMTLSRTRATQIDHHEFKERPTQ